MGLCKQGGFPRRIPENTHLHMVPSSDRGCHSPVSQFGGKRASLEEALLEKTHTVSHGEAVLSVLGLLAFCFAGLRESSAISRHSIAN